jgi:hypothetical protein
MELEYHNPDNERLRLREYGRTVQKMVDFACTVADQDRRRLLEEEIIRIMATVTPEATDKQEQRKKLWEHLVRISDFQLAADAPFEIERPALDTPPEPMPYYPHRAKYKQYGSNIELMIEQAKQMEAGEKKQAYIQLIAMMMKHFLQNRNANLASDEVVSEQLYNLSGGAIQIPPEEMEQMPPLASGSPKGRPDQRGGGSKRKKKPNKGQQPPQGHPKGGGGGNKGNRRNKGNNRKNRGNNA